MQNRLIDSQIEPRPRIIVSSLDLERIESIVDSLPEPQYAASSALLDELGRAEVVDPTEVPATVVTMNSKVRFSFEETGEEFCLTLVYPKDVDGQADTISVLAPVGSALLGLSVGDRIGWYGPKGDKIHIQVLEIPFQPESAGEYFR